MVGVQKVTTAQKAESSEKGDQRDTPSFPSTFKVSPPKSFLSPLTFSVELARYLELESYFKPAQSSQIHFRFRHIYSHARSKKSCSWSSWYELDIIPSVSSTRKQIFRCMNFSIKAKLGSSGSPGKNTGSQLHHMNITTFQ